MGKEFLDAFETHKLADIKTAGIILNVDAQTTVHLKMKKLSTKSSWDFECVLHTSDTY